MTVPDQHQFRIAKQTLRLSDAGALILAGMDKPTARRLLEEKFGWSKSRIDRYENASQRMPPMQGDAR